VVKHINGEKPPSRGPSELVSFEELQAIMRALTDVIEEVGGPHRLSVSQRDFVRVCHTLNVTWQRANELVRSKLEEAAQVAEEHGANEAAERIRGIA